MTTPIATLLMVTLDCADPAGQAAFYAGVLGWEVTHSEEEYAMVSDGRTAIGFGRVAGYAPPAWPDGAAPKRYHLDLRVEDMAAAEAACLALGARRPGFQPGQGRWLVLTDPAGHPFCLCPQAAGS